MFRVFTYRRSYKYDDILQSLVKSYNDSKHRSIGIAPSKITQDLVPQIFKETIWLYSEKAERNFKRGRSRITDEEVISKINQSIEEKCGRSVFFALDHKNVNVLVAPGYELILTAAEAPRLLTMLTLPREDRTIKTGIGGAVDFVFDYASDKIEITIEKNVELEFRLMYAHILMRMLSMEKDVVLTGTTHHVLQKIDRPPINEYFRLFKSFKHLAFNHLANNKVKVHIPQTSILNLQDGLRDLLRFKKATLHGGTHISDYPLELDGEITEIYVYSDIIESHFVGDTIAPLLRIIPVMSAKEDQIVVNYQRPSYFPLRNNYIDCIEIELKSSSGDAMKAGKYLGKHLLSAGSKVVSDVAAGASLKDSAKSRFRETTKKIKDDILHKIQTGSACTCVTSDLDLFNVSPVQLSIDSSSFIEVHPIASLGDNTPIEFFISASGEHYLDLSHVLIHLQAKITKKTGTAIGTTDQVAPINYFLNTLFSECLVVLNDKQVSSQANYAYRSIFDAMLAPKSVQESILTAGLFTKDRASKHDSVELANVGDKSNPGYQTRYNICKNSKLMDMIGPLHFDLGNQSKCFINSVNLRIKLERNKDAFALMSPTKDFKILIQHASLFVRKVKVAPPVLIAHEVALTKGVIKMPIRRTEVKSFALSTGTFSLLQFQTLS
ncbi:uncharacterized protein F54H12.2 [Trichonephila clavipes]|nr:uncharacterized protein F54H12.2 [Trichonephila clavipes]